MARNLLYKKKKLGSYPYFLVFFSLVFSLTIIGFWSSILLMGNQLQQSIKENITVQVYLQKEITPDSIAQIQRLVESRPYVLQKEGKAQVRFISKEASEKKFIEETGENFAAFMGENPLRDAFILNIDPAFSQSAQLKKIKEELSRQPGIFEVVYTEGLADAIHLNFKKLTFAAIAFTSVMLVVIFLLINNTIKLAMYSQRFLIRSMQLVGAKAWFIQKPYLLRSMWLGILGGLIASVLIMIMLEYGKSILPEMGDLLFLEKEFLLLGCLVLGGGLVCLFSSLLAVSRYLGTSLEELY
jgi:cell division transport system permease protein